MDRFRITSGLIGCLVLSLAFGLAHHVQVIAQTPTPNGMAQLQGNNNGFGQPISRVAALPTSASSPSTPPTSAANVDPSTNSDLGKIPVRNLLQMFHEGGILMYPIAICSIVLMVIVFERLVFLRAGRVIPKPFVRRLIEQLEQQQIEREEALALCDKNPSPIARVLHAAVRKYGRPAVEVEQAALDAGERSSNHLRRYLRLLNAISNVTPLLGLLGTVLGMIEAFNSIATADAMGRPELLAGGIGQALLTTAAGLLVAIPAYSAYMYFLGRTDRLVMDMDAYVQQVIDAISAEGLQENDTSRSRSRTRKNAA